MKFEEEFPSFEYLTLEDTVEGFELSYGVELTNKFKLNTGIIRTSKGYLQKHCLDKARVKEAIIKLDHKWRENEYATKGEYINWLWEELGLK